MSLFYEEDGILNTGRLNIEAVDIIHKKIDKSGSNKIIITGPRQSGKSVSLMSYERTKLNNENLTIYTLASNSDYNPCLLPNELCYKYELLLAKRILNYIKNYYPKIYLKQFIEIDKDINYRYDLFYKYITLKITSKSSLLNGNDELKKEWSKHQIKKGDIITKLITKIKQEIGTDKVTLIIDKYDWVENSSSRFQTIAKSFLEMFDKYIITSDDMSVYGNCYRKEILKNKGFDIIEVDYGKNHEIAKNIISKDINYCMHKKWIGQFGNSLYPIENIITKETYDKIIDKSNGDFGILYDSIRPIYMHPYFKHNNLNENILRFQTNSLNDRYNEETKVKVKTLHI